MIRISVGDLYCMSMKPILFYTSQSPRCWSLTPFVPLTYSCEGNNLKILHSGFSFCSRPISMTLLSKHYNRAHATSVTVLSQLSIRYTSVYLVWPFLLAVMTSKPAIQTVIHSTVLLPRNWKGLWWWEIGQCYDIKL